MFQASASSFPQPAGQISLKISELKYFNFDSGEAAEDNNNDDIGYLLAKRKGFDSLRYVQHFIHIYKYLIMFSGYTFGKRNFDELDRARFSAFAKRANQKRNFDEIDRARFGAFHKKNFDELDRAGFGAFHKRNFDELDRARFGAFHKRNFDEIDKVGFGAFNRYFK